MITFIFAKESPNGSVSKRSSVEGGGFSGVILSMWWIPCCREFNSNCKSNKSLITGLSLIGDSFRLSADLSTSELVFLTRWREDSDPAAPCYITTSKLLYTKYQIFSKRKRKNKTFSFLNYIVIRILNIQANKLINYCKNKKEWWKTISNYFSIRGRFDKDASGMKFNNVYSVLF